MMNETVFYLFTYYLCIPISIYLCIITSPSSTTQRQLVEEEKDSPPHFPHHHHQLWMSSQHGHGIKMISTLSKMFQMGGKPDDDDAIQSGSTVIPFHAADAAYGL